LGVDPSVQEPPSEDEEALFLQALATMDAAGPGAVPSSKAARATDGRPTVPSEASSLPPVDLRAEDAVFEAAMEALARGDGPQAQPEDELTTRPTGREQARRFVGTPKALRRRIRSGEIVPHAQLDLHGMRRPEARRALAAFLRDAVGQGHEVLRIIVGRGLHSAQGPVLREAVREWLRDDHGRVVAEVVSAPPAYGGEGVWYAFLRRFS